MTIDRRGASLQGPSLMSGRYVRPFEDCDAEAVMRLDASFRTQRVFQVHRTGEIISLSSVPIDNPIEKCFPLQLDQDPWQCGWVAVENKSVVGFIATALHEWNRRLIIWHFYVERSCRKRGFGRLLLEHATDSGVDAGAITAWAETSNLNYPGVQPYRRLGFTIVGFDLTLYRGTPSRDEFAVFLGRPIGADQRAAGAEPF
jgi:ribosomal protein S18 acetylase RimI-like enzyme